MINLYELIGILPTAKVNEVEAALRKAAENRLLPLSQLEKVRDTLLNTDIRARYDEKLYQLYPALKDAPIQHPAVAEVNKASPVKTSKKTIKLASRPAQTNTQKEGKKSGWGLGKLINGMFGNMSEVSIEHLESQFSAYLFDEESITFGYQLIRDVIIFTDRRILFVDKQGATGKKQSFKSIYLMNIVDVEMETAGMGLDDNQIVITCMKNINLKAYNEHLLEYKFEFPKNTDILPLYRYLGSLAFRNRIDINGNS